MRLTLHRLLTNPTTHVEAVDGETVRLRVEGLVCDSVCAVRTKEAIEAMDGVRRADVDFETGIVTIEGKAAAPEAYERAVRGAVAGKPLRRAVDVAAAGLRRKPRAGRQPR
jgi:copper chaperone CopZ